MYTLADKYYVKAADEYPFNLEETLENLEYALSYDPEHAAANRLMGVMKREELKDYKGAEECFCLSLATDPDSLETCGEYLQLLLILKKTKEARRLICYMEKLPGADIARLLAARARLSEMSRAYDEALHLLREAMLETCCSTYMMFLEEEKERVQSKCEMLSQIKAVIV
ncbi:hypothetical protein AB9P05_17655 [Roseivirga sp. BDSF3-8]|uniref:hypothetical protein n=1 Tax=Roseivirga sp. BDSF3-8 TaxID=3241598 RepID=UPI0035326D14